MSKATNWISLLLFLVLLALIGVYAALRIPYLRAKNEMPEVRIDPMQARWAISTASVLS